MEKSVASLMDKIRKYLELLDSSLPKRVDGYCGRLPCLLCDYEGRVRNGRMLEAV